MFDNIIVINNKSYDLKILFDLSGRKLVLSEFDNKINAQLHSYQISGINITKYNLEKLFSNKQFFNDLTAQRNEKLNFLFQEIKDLDVLSFYEQFRPFIDLLNNKINNQTLITDLKPNKIAFNPTGSKDGRLTIKKGFLNLFSLPKEERHRIKCKENFRFVQFDYRSFQPRIAIFLTDNENFKSSFAHKEDIYEGTSDREKQKLKFFQVTFGKEVSDTLQLRPIFDLRKKIFEEIRTKGKIISPFGRPIFFHNEEENVIFRNFITTCESDMIFTAAAKLDILLNGRQSKINWIFHDAIMFEIYKDEISLIKEIKNLMENNYGYFPVKTSIGRTFGELYDLPDRKRCA